MFEEEYEILFNFLGGWFPDMDFDNLTEEDIVKEYKSVVDEKRVKALIQEAEEVKTRITDYWKKISIDTNIYLENEREALKWLDNIVKLLKKQ
jgi:hypothetical protein